MHISPEDPIAATSMLLLGLLSSGHCLGMCGPLVIALPGRYGRWQAHAAYHLGRLITYTLVGAVMGLIGGGLARTGSHGTAPAMSGLAHMQVWISLTAALFLLLLGLQRLGIVTEPAWLAKAAPQRIPGFGGTLRRVRAGESLLPLFGMGLMLGLLPCGMSYAVFARALATGSPGTAAELSLWFGMGTLPALLVLGTGAAVIFQRYRTQTEFAAGLLMIGMSLSLAIKAIF